MEPQLSPLPSVGMTDYLGVLRRRSRLVFVPFLGCLVLAALLIYVLPAQYTASLQMEVQDRQLTDKFFQQVDFTLPLKPYLVTIAEVIKSRHFVRDLVDRHGIHEGYDISDPKERSRLYDRVVQNINVRLVEQEIGSDLIEITYTGRDAKKVADFLNSLHRKYTDYVLGIYRQAIADAREDLTKRHEAARLAYDQMASQYEGFKQRNDFQLIGDKTLVSKLQDLARQRAALVEAEQRRLGLEEQLDRLRATLRETRPEEIRSTKEKNPALLEQQGVITRLEDALADARNKWHEIAPAVVALKTELERERAKLQRIPEFVEVKREEAVNTKYQDLDIQVAKLEAELEGTEARIKRIRTEVEGLEQARQSIPGLTRQDEDFRSRVDEALASQERLGRSLAAINGLWNRSNSQEGGFFRVLRKPIKEEADSWEPVFPDIPIFMGVGSFIGLLLGAGLAFITEFASHSFVTPLQIQRSLPVPLLGQVGVLEIPSEARSRRRRRLLMWLMVFVLLVLAAAVHFCYFQTDLQQNLPPWVFKVMQRVYGAR